MIEITLMNSKVLVSFDDIEVTLHIRSDIRTHVVHSRPYDLNFTNEGSKSHNRVYYCGSLLRMYESD